MSLRLGFTIYLVLWWLTLFMVLPWGIKRSEAYELNPVKNPDAPSKARLLIKLTLTTVISGIFFANFYFILEAGWISFR